MSGVEGEPEQRLTGQAWLDEQDRQAYARQRMFDKFNELTDEEEAEQTFTSSGHIYRPDRRRKLGGPDAQARAQLRRRVVNQVVSRADASELVVAAEAPVAHEVGEVGADQTASTEIIPDTKSETDSL
jgi:predicted nucleic acid-binding Zn ribbon protein